jgi:hypothetical protein
MDHRIKNHSRKPTTSHRSSFLKGKRRNSSPLLPLKAEKYFKERAPEAIPFLPKLIPEKKTVVLPLSRLSRKWTFRPLDLMVSQLPLSG